MVESWGESEDDCELGVIGRNVQVRQQRRRWGRSRTLRLGGGDEEWWKRGKQQSQR